MCIFMKSKLKSYLEREKKTEKKEKAANALTFKKVVEITEVGRN